MVRGANTLALNVVSPLSLTHWASERGNVDNLLRIWSRDGMVLRQD